MSNHSFNITINLYAIWMLKVKVTSNVLLEAQKGCTGVSVFICSLVDTWGGGGCLTPLPGRFTPGERT